VIWCETGICEERGADGTTVTRRAFTLGEQAAGVARFFAADHLGSVGEVTNGSSTVLARYVYDPWGRRSLTTGTDVTKVGYTGHQWQATGGVWLTQFRGYDAELGRWASEDPYHDNQVAAPEAPLPGDSIAALLDDAPSVDEPDWSSLADSADPMPITPDGPNLYGYVRNQPTSLVDPTGQWAALIRPIVTIVVKKVINECKKIRCKPVRIDPPHHKFPLIGKRCHAQLNCWRQGVKGSGFTVRVPVPCSWRK
jgi:RHS repeat-associated protein